MVAGAKVAGTLNGVDQGVVRCEGKVKGMVTSGGKVDMLGKERRWSCSKENSVQGTSFRKQ